MSKFQAPRGTRDFLPEEMILREKVFETVKSVFKRYGYDPLKTPSIEHFELFAMKESIGSGEQDKLYVFEDKSGRKLALRFDQTVPLARVVASNPQLPKPFKRYEISRVWRYEEIKRGRYREFWQCDIDVVGSKSMSADAEVIDCAMTALEELGFSDCSMRINNRKLLTGIMEFVGIPEKKIKDVFRVIDKLDKIGLEGVEKELKDLGIAEEKREKIFRIIDVKLGPSQVIEKTRNLVGNNRLALEGLKELEDLLLELERLGRKNVIIDLSLVRGLDYYTSTIFEITSSDKKIGSLGGGGRYDEMIGAFGGNQEVPAVGIALGIERIIELLKERLKEKKKTETKVFVANVDEETRKFCVEISKKLRRVGVNTQIDLMDRSLKKQMEYVNSLGIPYCIIVGKDEVKSGKFKVKDMSTGEERLLGLEEILSFFT